MRVKPIILASVVLSITVLIVSLYLGAKREAAYITPIPYLYIESEWADSVLSELDASEQAAQLMMVKTRGVESIDSFITRLDGRSPGGVWLSGFPFQTQTTFVEWVQHRVTVPALIAIDEPLQGLGFPDPMALASVATDSQINFIGTGLALQARTLGAQLQISKSLMCKGYTPEMIEKSVQIFRPIVRSHLLSGMECDCKGNEFDQIFKEEKLKAFSQDGLTSAIVSSSILEDDSTLIAMRNAFQGLILMTLPDSLASDLGILTQALASGADMLIVRDSVKSLHASLTQLVANGGVNVRPRLKKLMLAKYWSRPHYTPALDSIRFNQLNRRFNEATLTVVKDDLKQIPLTKLAEKAPLLITLGERLPRFETFFSYYTQLDTRYLKKEDSENWPSLKVSRLQGNEPVIVALNHVELDSIADSTFLQSLGELAKRTKVILLNIGPLSQLAAVSDLPTILHVYNAHPSVQDLPAQLLMGGARARARLPMAVGSLEEGTGVRTPLARLGYEQPEAVGIRSDLMKRIDTIARIAIGRKALPGCQVFVAKNGKVIYSKAFGHHTYDRRRPVRTTDLYDIASVTKVAATTLAAMKLYEQKKLPLSASLGEFFEDTFIELDAPIDEHAILSDTFSFAEFADSLRVWEATDVLVVGDSLPQKATDDSTKLWAELLNDTLIAVHHPVRMTLSVTSNIFAVRISELLTHHSGLQPALPILPYLNHRDASGSRFGAYYSPEKTDSFSIEVARNFYMRNDLADSLWLAMKYMRRYNRKIYQYSDVNMVLLQRAIDTINDANLSDYLEATFYRELGLNAICYKPLDRFKKDRIIPSAHDLNWRRQLLHGHVHDPSAALMGGISGNAGLFATANDLGVLYQMLLNGGIYGGKRFLEPETIKLFTSPQQGHRGFGFDRPPSIVGKQASRRSYGHTGFTGTCVWVDPQHQLVYIFLSNRVYPSEKNWRINRLRIRQRIHDAIYDAIEAGLES